MDLLKSKAIGKKKKGATKVRPQMVLCELICTNKETFQIRSGVKGILLEANEQLASNPSLITQQPMTDGFVAIVQPKPDEIRRIRKEFKTKAQYSELRQGVAKKHVQELFASSS